jgi:hypothetical protein
MTRVGPQRHINGKWLIWLQKLYCCLNLLQKLPIFLGTRSQIWEKRLLGSSCLSVCLHETTRLSLVRFFMKSWFLSAFRNYVGKIQVSLPLSDPTSDLVRQYDFPVPFRCRKKSDTVFVAFVCPLSEPVRRFYSCSTDFSQQIAQVVLFLFLYFFLF